MLVRYGLKSLADRDVVQALEEATRGVSRSVDGLAEVSPLVRWVVRQEVVEVAELPHSSCSLVEQEPMEAVPGLSVLPES